MYKISTHIEQSDLGQDSLVILSKNETVLFCLADGAGGVSGGKEAAQFVSHVSHLTELDSLHSPEEFEAYLRNMDAHIYSDPLLGETTAIIGKIHNGELIGASVGDSECWLLSDEFDYELTSMKVNKPLLGSSSSQPIGFGPIGFHGVILIGSDGLFKYAEREKIKELSLSSNSVAANYVALAQLRSGVFPDDVAVIEIRNAL